MEIKMNKLVSLDDIKSEVENFDKFTLQEYYHKDYMSTYEGSKICDFICELVDTVKVLQDRIERFETGSIRENMVFDRFTNICRDGDGKLIGKCLNCGCVNTDIENHICD